MPNNYFSFKKFTVYQDGAAMKVGTDGVILGAWSKLTGDENRILDIGTGTGLIALMAAQRTSHAVIDAIEIEKDAAAQACKNIDLSPWEARIKVINKSLQEYEKIADYRYDHILSNPPYFINSLKSEDLARTAARHAELLPYEDLIRGVVNLMKPDGLFSAIFPYEQANIFIALAAVSGLFCTHRLNIYPTPQRSVKRVALCFSKNRFPVIEDNIVIEDSGRHGYSDDYKKLTGDFYVRF